MVIVPVRAGARCVLNGVFSRNFCFLDDLKSSSRYVRASGTDSHQGTHLGRPYFDGIVATVPSDTRSNEHIAVDHIRLKEGQLAGHNWKGCTNTYINNLDRGTSCGGWSW
jgi:hypothetical protein